MVTNNFASFYSCGSVKHGWEKKWVVLADQMLQLYDKENMGGETVFRNPPILQGVYRNDKTLTFLLFQKIRHHPKYYTYVAKMVTSPFILLSCHQN